LELSSRNSEEKQKTHQNQNGGPTSKISNAEVLGNIVLTENCKNKRLFGSRVKSNIKSLYLENREQHF
jgi:hypothetical protein